MDKKYQIYLNLKYKNKKWVQNQYKIKLRQFLRFTNNNNNNNNLKG